MAPVHRVPLQLELAALCLLRGGHVLWCARVRTGVAKKSDCCGSTLLVAALQVQVSRQQPMSVLKRIVSDQQSQRTFTRIVAPGESGGVI